MRKLINWQIVNEQSIYDQLKTKLEEYNVIDKTNIEGKFGILQQPEEMDYLQKDYEIYYEKLELTSDISNLDIEKQKGYIDFIIKLDSLENITDKQKLKMMISWGVLVSYFSKIHERSDDEKLMLSALSTELHLDNYTEYIGILSNKDVSTAIISKSIDLSEQVKIANAVMKTQDELPIMTSESYDGLVVNAIEVVNSYNIDKSLNK